MILASPPASDIVSYNGTSSATGIVSVPGGRWLTANIQLSTTVSNIAGSSSPHVTYVVPGGTSGAAPANGSVLARITATSILGQAVTAQDTIEVIVWGGDNGCTLDFTAGASGTSSVVINGFLI